MKTSSQHAAVRLALVGAGGHGRTLQDAIADTDAAEMRTVFDVDQAALDEAANRFGVDPASSYEDVLRRDDLEAIVIATPNALHRRHTEAAFETGFHVLLEKPIADSVSDGRAIVEAAEDAGRLLMVGHDMRRSRVARRTKRALQEGVLGKVVSMEIHFSTDTAMHLNENSWRLESDGRSLLPMVQLGIHGVDLVQYFFEPMETVYAEARSITTPPRVMDSVAATFRTRDGIHGTMISNYCSKATFEYRISGTLATLQSSGHTLRIQKQQGAAEHGEETTRIEDYSDHTHESYARELKAFAQAVRGHAEIETDGWAGLQAIAVVEALQRSVETETSQAVPNVCPEPTAA